MDENTSKLFVEINPNIDQLAKEQEEVKNEVVSEKELENLPAKEEEIFDEPPAEKPKRGRKKKEVKFEAEDLPMTPPTTPIQENSKPKTTAQLEKEERKRLREAEAKAKALAKEEKRREGQERNRQKARERYRRIAEEKKQKKAEEEKQVRKEIVKDNTKPSRMPTKEPQMDFGTFASYMMKYEDLKLQYAKQQEQKKKMEEEAKPKPKPVEKSYHPAKYPLQNLYDPRKRYNNAFPHDNFF
jgi:hypothetical protein